MIKRLSLPTIIVMLCAGFAACGNKTNGAADNADSLADAAAKAAAMADSVAAAEARWTADSERLAKQETPDLEYMEVHGPVKSITYNEPTMT